MLKQRIKKVVSLSSVRELAAGEFEVMRRDPHLDPVFFTEEELEHYIQVLIRSLSEEWIVIDDEGTFQC